jgi:hypothetical protein
MTRSLVRVQVTPPQSFDTRFGMLAQLVERRIRIAKAGGSTPPHSTKIKPLAPTLSFLYNHCVMSFSPAERQPTHTELPANPIMKGALALDLPHPELLSDEISFWATELITAQEAGDTERAKLITFIHGQLQELAEEEKTVRDLHIGKTPLNPQNAIRAAGWQKVTVAAMSDSRLLRSDTIDDNLRVAAATLEMEAVAETLFVDVVPILNGALARVALHASRDVMRELGFKKLSTQPNTLQWFKDDKTGIFVAATTPARPSRGFLQRFSEAVSDKTEEDDGGKFNSDVMYSLYSYIQRRAWKSRSLPPQEVNQGS